MQNLACFKAYDLRGRVPEELDADLAYRLGRAYCTFLSPSRVAVGRDVRLSSPELAAALRSGLNDGGAEVLDLGLCGTEQVYFHTFHLQLNGGIMITASHNPREYNGMKLVGPQARPLSRDWGLEEIKSLVGRENSWTRPQSKGRTVSMDSLEAYGAHLLNYLADQDLQSFKIVVNPGNGCAGPVLDYLEPHLPVQFIKVHYQPDGDFPHGVPNPLLPENREATARAVREQGADLGLAWDGDFDRCFFFDEQGEFVESYYLLGFLAQTRLARHPGAAIIHDPRLTWNTIEMVTAAGGRPVLCKTGHAFIKDRMRLEDAAYGGEMSGHHYFREFAYCDTGMVPWLLVLEILSRYGQPLSSLVHERKKRYPVSGEINRRLQEPEAAVRRVQEAFEKTALKKDLTDGLSLEFPEWRFNLRPSQTEPVLRLNVETRQNPALLQEKTQALLEMMV